MPTENNFQKTSNTYFNKKDFVKMGGTVLFTLLVVYSLNIILNPAPPLDASHLISTIEMRNYYNQYTDSARIPILYNVNGSQQVGKLEGFPIATSDLEDIIHNNKYTGTTGQRILPDKILFYLGQDGTFDDSMGQKYGNIKMIAVGVTGSTLMVPTNQADMNNKLKSSIYDKAMPCPGPGCPTKPPPPPPISN